VIGAKIALLEIIEHIVLLLCKPIQHSTTEMFQAKCGGFPFIVEAVISLKTSSFASNTTKKKLLEPRTLLTAWCSISGWNSM
jgi:hypothetical protein